MEAYGDAKARIFENQASDEHLIINYDDKNCFNLARDCKAQIVPFSRLEKLRFGAFIDDGKIVIADNDIVNEICDVKDIKILGNHNIENVLAAAAISYFAGVSVEDIAKGIIEFKGVEHRIEYVGIIDGINYYNDSKGTNTDATIIALNALKKDIILIAGGDGKDQNFNELGKALIGKVKHLVLLGRDAKAIEESALRAGFDSIFIENDMNDCVLRSAKLAEEGDNVLLSPACASWDMYENFEQRGNHFKSCVELLNN